MKSLFLPSFRQTFANITFSEQSVSLFPVRGLKTWQQKASNDTISCWRINVNLSVIDYDLGHTTQSESNFLKLDMVQNEAMRVEWKQQKTHPLRPSGICHRWKSDKIEQAKVYSIVVQNLNSPLHDAVKEEKGCSVTRTCSRTYATIHSTCSTQVGRITTHKNKLYHFSYTIFTRALSHTPKEKK